MGGWGSVLFKVALLSSPLPARTTLLLCSARCVSGTIHSLISMWHSRLKTPLGVGSRYAFLHQTYCIFISSSISKPPLTLVNKTCMNPMTEYNLGKDRIQDKMPGLRDPSCMHPDFRGLFSKYLIWNKPCLRFDKDSEMEYSLGASPRTIDIVKKKISPGPKGTLHISRHKMTNA